MRNACLLLSVLVLLSGALAGCGNVSLQGEAMTAAQQSAMDAWQAYTRAGSTGIGSTGVSPVTTAPTGETPVVPSTSWLRPYLRENFIQWRAFVRSANKNTAWGPKLPGE